MKKKASWIALALLVVLATLTTGAPQASAAEPVQYPSLSKGSRGNDVRAAQYLLRYFGRDPGATDGKFGSGTETAVKNFQGDRGMSKDGVVGPGTWKALTGRASITWVGQTNDKVRALSQLLTKWDGGATFSTYTSTAENRVKAFQRHMGIGDDGDVGPTTWRYLAFHYRLAYGEICKASNPNDSRPADRNGAENHARDGWGTAATTAYVAYTAGKMKRDYSPTIGSVLPVRDLSHEHGGDIVGHSTHERGMDVDLYFYTYSNTKDTTCNGARHWTSTTVNSRATAQKIRFLKGASTSLGRDLHKVTLINDTIVLNALASWGSEVQWFVNHDAHTHTRFCTAYYPYSSSYDC